MFHTWTEVIIKIYDPRYQAEIGGLHPRLCWRELSIPVIASNCLQLPELAYIQLQSLVTRMVGFRLELCGSNDRYARRVGSSLSSGSVTSLTKNLKSLARWHPSSEDNLALAKPTSRF